MPTKAPSTAARTRSGRRDFLKRSAIVAGAAWVAPQISVTRHALAQGGAGSPVLTCSTCTVDAYGVFQDVLTPASTHPPSPTSPCPPAANPCTSPLSIGAGIPGTILIVANGACGCTTMGAGGSVCRAEGQVAGLTLRVNRSIFGPSATSDLVVTADILHSSTAQNCPQCGPANRATHIVNLRITFPSGTFTSIGGATAPNTVITDSMVLFPGFRIIANHQDCEGPNWFTSALDIRLPTAAPTPGRRIVLGHSEARSDGCTDPCTAPPYSMPLVPIV